MEDDDDQEDDNGRPSLTLFSGLYSEVVYSGNRRSQRKKNVSHAVLAELLSAIHADSPRMEVPFQRAVADDRTREHVYLTLHALFSLTISSKKGAVDAHDVTGVNDRRAKIDAERATLRAKLERVERPPERISSLSDTSQPCPVCDVKTGERCVYRSVLGTVVVEPFVHDQRRRLKVTTTGRVDAERTEYDGRGFPGDWLFAAMRYRRGFTPAGGGWRRGGADHGG